MDHNRRAFIKQTCTLCASLIGIVVLPGAIQSCAPIVMQKSVIENGKIVVQRSVFSVENKLVVLRNPSLEFDIAVVWLETDVYKAFELQCTHQANALLPTKSGFFCSAHGSSFSFDGKVKNEPALRDLKEYPIQMNSEQLIIQLT
jgi:Rieske Fe-S protein